MTIYNQITQKCSIKQLISDLPCWVTGLCEGIVVDVTISEDGNSCMDLCIQNDDCLWFTYDSSDNACLLLEDCQQLDSTCDSCLSGHRLCPAQQEGKKNLYKHEIKHMYKKCYKFTFEKFVLFDILSLLC